MTKDQLDSLVASAQSLDALVSSLQATPPAGGDVFTQEDADAVVAKLDELKTAIEALVVPAA